MSLIAEYAFTSCDNKIQDVSGNRHGSHGKINYDYISRLTWVTPDSFQLHPLDLIVGINSYSSWPHVHHLWLIIATEQRCRNCRNLHYPSIIPSYNIHILYEYIIIIISTVPIDIQRPSRHHPFTNQPCLAIRCDTTAAAWLCHVARPGGEMLDGFQVSFTENIRFPMVSNLSIYLGVNSIWLDINKFIKHH